MNGIRSAVEIKDPLVKPKVDVETLASIDPSTMEDSFVYVHCHFNNTSDDMLIRIWSTTFLVDRYSAARSQLIHAENISYAPQWTIIPRKGDFTFLLIFGGLPKNCLVFDMIEEIAQPGGFHIKNIKRNETDVYHIDLL
ncbi:MAG: hypothetical protein LW721_09705 [Flammeovirgaceae bacterium]|jgi:hypothetical protein|nr:hypothetical protein [Flammeovirgaceae bacterium]